MPHRLQPPSRRTWRQRLTGWFGGRAAVERDLMFHLAPGLQVILDDQHRIRRCNQAWEVLLGWREADLIGRDISELQHPNDVADAIERGRLPLERGATISGLENRLRHRDGSYRLIRWYARRLDDSRMYAFGQDITESSQAERERDLFFSLAPGL